MKKLLLLILMFPGAANVFANHIVGGEMYYRYLGPGNIAGTSAYEISLRLFRDCDVPCGEGTSTACLPIAAPVAIYPASAPYTPFYVINMPRSGSTSITLTSYPDCIANKPSVCYEVKTYSFRIQLPDTDDGYIIAYQNCCRAEARNQYGNAFTGSSIPGATYTANIPGKEVLSSAHNSSAIFKLKDTALACSGGKFSIDFGATDADNDSLSFAFSPAFDGGIFWSDGCTYDLRDGLVCENTVAGPPPYNFISYNSALGFSGFQPLGEDVSIDPATGLITGVAPSEVGHYIVNVMVYEWRNKKLIASHQKDFIIQVADCGLPQARLQPSFQNCKGLDVSFKNQSTSPLIFSYYWDFGDVSTTGDTSSNPTPTYLYPDSGTYTVTLITNKGQQCSDTGTALAKVYPGFTADFDVKGGCIFAPFEFTDLTIAKYGTVNSWRWDFGDFATMSDTSRIPDPQYSYADTQKAEVRLIAGSSNGCVDTARKVIDVYKKPPLQLAFKDTLICANDTLQLRSADTTGTISWFPAINITDANIPDPRVYPDTSTVYHLTVSDNNCVSTDSVRVNVVPFAIMNAGSDTTICLTDSVQLFPQTNALHFTWTPATGLSDVNAKDPVARPLTNIQYVVTATVGGCTAADSIKINVAPYPKVVSSADTAICFGKTTQLFAKTDAAIFVWTPSNSLLNSNTLTPMAGPQTTTAYVISARNTTGCTRPAFDTTIIIVRPPVAAFAGHDTTVVADQPLQLHATGGTYYEWTPSTGMSDPHIADPIVTLGKDFDSVLYRLTVSTKDGCNARDEIKVAVFKTPPDIFVATAFTPNDDGLNDVLHPKLIGIKQFNYFRVYNRFGHLIFSTATPGEGWDGKLAGIKQPAGTYVYTAQAIDYTGKMIQKKGTVVLIK